MIQTVNNKIMLSDTAYNVGKKLVQVYIPALSSLYFGLASIWGLPAVEQVVGTLAVLATFLGVCLGLSSKQYDQSGAAFDGKIVVTKTDDGKTLFSLNLDGDPAEIENMSVVSFKVEPHTDPV